MNLRRPVNTVLGVLLLHSTACTGHDTSDAQVSGETPASALARNAEGVKLIPPITLVEANEFSDGGTTFVRLKDAKQREFLFCVSESAFAKVVPANTLFLEATHPRKATARLPSNTEEAHSIVAALEAALAITLPPSERKEFENWGDPLEHYWHESNTKPASEQRPLDDWKKICAFDALRRLQSKTEFATLGDSNSPKPAWYDAYDEQRQEGLAEERRVAEEDMRFKGFYPESVRDLLAPANLPDLMQVQPDGEESRKKDEPEVQQGKRLAEAVAEPVKLAEISCRAVGILNDSWTVLTTRDRIAIEAMLTVAPEDFSASLPRLGNEDSALLGAARFFFYYGYGNHLSTPGWEAWISPLTKAVLEKGADANKDIVVRILARSDHDIALQLLRQVARGEFGIEKDLEKQWDKEPGLKESAYLALALRSDETVRKEIREALKEAKVEQNVAALELSLALLGDPSYLKPKIFELDSYSIGMAALQAIERFGGKYGMDMLMSAGLDHSYAAVANEALMTAQRITGETWVPEQTRFQPIKFADEAKTWWKDNRDRFASARSE